MRFRLPRRAPFCVVDKSQPVNTTLTGCEAECQMIPREPCLKALSPVRVKELSDAPYEAPPLHVLIQRPFR